MSVSQVDRLSFMRTLSSGQDYHNIAKLPGSVGQISLES
jgi:hypothetical protein